MDSVGIIDMEAELQTPDPRKTVLQANHVPPALDPPTAKMNISRRSCCKQVGMHEEKSGNDNGESD